MDQLVVSPATTALTPGVAGHLRRLVHAGSLLADLSRADIMVLTPIDTEPGASSTVSAEPSVSPAQAFSVIAHVRPINARTLYPVDQVGEILTSERRPLVAHAWATGEITDGGVMLTPRNRWIRTLVVPVTYDDKVVAILAREFSPAIEEMPGDLELISFAMFRRLAAMISSGTFPFGVETRAHDHPPRVGDGVMLLDRAGRLEYASPNALTVMRQVGAAHVNLGQRFGDMNIDATGVHQAFANHLPYTDEIELGDAVLSTFCLPLMTRDVVTGALVLVRNITELRQRDRLLLTRDATIAEIHHRVKNSLQTVSSLLQLQSRRVQTADARVALQESVRRIRSIATVHELLSRRTDDEVRFDEILRSLTGTIRESLIDPSHPVHFTIVSAGTVLPNNLTTSLSLVASELIQNALDHADCSAVTIEVQTEPEAVVLSVHDDGSGFPPDMSIPEDFGLGLVIVRTIVESELSGEMTLSTTDHGGKVDIRVPLYRHPVEGP